MKKGQLCYSTKHYPKTVEAYTTGPSAKLFGTIFPSNKEGVKMSGSFYSYKPSKEYLEYRAKMKK